MRLKNFYDCLDIVLEHFLYTCLKHAESWRQFFRVLCLNYLVLYNSIVEGEANFRQRGR